MIGKEQDETSEEDSEDEAYDDFTNNRDNVTRQKQIKTNLSQRKVKERLMRKSFQNLQKRKRRKD